MDDSDHGRRSTDRRETPAGGDASSRTRRRFIATGLTGLAGTALGVGSAAGRKRVGDAVVAAAGGGDYQSITAAIDDASPGDVLSVYPGEYEGTVVVDVPQLSLLSMVPGGATIRDGWAAASPALTVAADGVRVQGFRVTHPDGRLGISVDGGLSNVTVALNYVTGIGPYQTPGATGINVGTPQTGLSIVENVVENVSSVLGEGTSYPVSEGITLNAAPDTGDDVETTAEAAPAAQQTAALTDSVVRDNVVRWLTSEYACRGIALAADAARLDVRHNDLFGIEATNERDEPRTYAWGFHSGGRSDAVRFQENVVDDVRASTYVGTGVMVRGRPDGLTVTENDLTTTLGVQNETTTALAATLNWWGHRNGPRSVPSNQSADDGSRLDGQGAYVGPVRIEPWLTGTVQTNDGETNWYVDGRLSETTLDEQSEPEPFRFPTLQ